MEDQKHHRHSSLLAVRTQGMKGMSMDGRSKTSKTNLTFCENTRDAKRVSMGGKSETPQTHQLTPYENERRMSMDRTSEIPQNNNLHSAQGMKKE